MSVRVVYHHSSCHNCSKLADIFKWWPPNYPCSTECRLQTLCSRLRLYAGLQSPSLKKLLAQTTLTYVVTDCLQSSLFFNNEELLSVSRTAAEGLCVDFTQNFTDFWRPSNEIAPRRYFHWLRPQLVVSRRVTTATCKVAATEVFWFADIRFFLNIHCFTFKVFKSVHHGTIQINHHPDATVFQFIILTFIYSSTCFGPFPAHHQDLNYCSGGLWFYLRIVVIIVLCSWSGRPDHEHSTIITTILR
jgi:hypothetical protein